MGQIFLDCICSCSASKPRQDKGLALAALFSLLGVQVQMLGSSLLARRTAAVAATGQRGQLAAVLMRLTLDTSLVVLVSLLERCVIGHLPGSPDLHGTRGYVRWTDLGRPVAVAAAVPEQDQLQSLKPETH